MDKAWNDGITWGSAGMSYSNPASEEQALEKVLQKLKDGKMSVYKVNGSKNAHWVVICGYQVCEDSTGPSDLRNFIIIDPADGQEKRLGDRYVTYNREYNKDAGCWVSTNTPKPAVCTVEN